MKTIHDPSYRAIVARLRKARLERGLTQAKLAASVGRSNTWLSKVESCEVRLDLLQLSQLCEAVGDITPAEIMAGI